MLLFVALVLLLNQGCSGWSLKSWYFCRSAGIACLYHLASVPFWQSKEASSQFSYVMFWFIFVPETSTCTVIDDQSLLNSQCYKNITFPPESFVYASLQNNPPKAEFKTGAGPCDLCIMLFRSVPCQMINHNYQLPQRLQYRQQSPPEFRGSVKSHQRGALPKCAPPPLPKAISFPGSTEGGCQARSGLGQTRVMFTGVARVLRFLTPLTAELRLLSDECWSSRQGFKAKEAGPAFSRLVFKWRLLPGWRLLLWDLCLKSTSKRQMVPQITLFMTQAHPPGDFFLSLSLSLFYSTCMIVLPAYMYAHHMLAQCQRHSEEGIECPRTGVTDSC